VAPDAPNGTTTPGVVTALAELPAAAHIEIGALATMLGRHKKSIERAVRRGELPPPIRFLGKQVWLVDVIREHMRARQEAAIKAACRRGAKREHEIPMVKSK
jgi:hypothetical protein